MKNIKHMKGIVVGNRNITIKYADDTVLIVNSQVGLRRLVKELTDKSPLNGLNINCKKMKVLVISKEDTPRAIVRVNGTILPQIEK